MVRTCLWAAGVAAALALLDLLGVPVIDWIRTLFHKVAEVPAWAVGAGILLETLQTSFAALAWLAILRAAFPRTRVSFRLVLASYATAVALNGFLPANLGTWVMLVMFASVIAGATFAAVFSGLVVQKIPFSVFNIALYLYLFLSVSGSFSIKLGFVSDHAALLAHPGRRRRRSCWRCWRGSSGGASPSFAPSWPPAEPSCGSPGRPWSGWPCRSSPASLARLGIIAVFLGAYGIPVTFHNVASVSASNSVSNSVSVTPGGVGVTQAMNTAVLSNSTGSANATAYSVSQQLITSAWDVVFAVVLVSWVFGWSGGRELVRSSYGEARERSRDFTAERRARRRTEGAPES